MTTPRKPVLGLMGQPGSGKSTVAAVLAEMGGGVIDADALARSALDRPEVAARLAAWWGDGVLLSDGRVDRAAVGCIVFDDPEQLRRLESVVHPIVAEGRVAARRVHQQDPSIRFIVEDCPLLIETGLDRDCDRLLLVEAPRAARLERVRARGWDAAELDRREDRQASLDTKRRHADDVIENDGEINELLAKTRRVIQSLLNPAS